MKKKKRLSGIERRWFVNNVGVIMLLVLACVLGVVLYMAAYYDTNLRSGLENRAKTTTDFFSNYIGQSYNEYYQSCIKFAKTFEDKDRLELQFISPGGKIVASSYGKFAGRSPSTPEIQQAIDSQQTRHYKGRNPLTGERILAVSSPMIYTNGEVIGVLRYVTSLRNADLQVLMIALIAVTVGLLFIGSIFFLSSFFIRSILVPVSQINATAKRIAAGSYGVQIPGQYDDEIGELQNSFNFMVRRISVLIDERYNLGKNLKDMELRALQAQINPHFLYNTLDLISWKATANGDMETVDIVVKLARFYRLSLSNGSDFLPLSDEAEHVRLFVELTNLSRGRTVELITKIDPSIADYPIMKLILQPIVENSLFHGLYELDDRAGVICLSAERIGSYVQIRIQDNGIGMDKGKLTEILAKKDKPVVNTKRGGYGIGNILERLHIYYDDDFMFEIDSAILVGTTVTIRVPYSRNDSPQIHAERPIGGAEQN